MLEKITDTREKRALFSESRFVFLGEAIHGVAEFTRFRLAVARRFFCENSILLFEADSTGMLLSHQRRETAYLRLKNFPLVMRTQEILQLLTWGIDRQIPCLGIDCIPRHDLTDFPPNWQPQRRHEVAEFIKMKSSTDYFEQRDARMAGNLLIAAMNYPKHRMLIMLHNLHIKRQGSRENNGLRLRSVREHLEEIMPEQSTAIAQLARGGRALHNDLTPFDFQIDDPLSLETHLDGVNHILLPASRIPPDRVAWHHAFERETLPVREQYEGCLVYGRVHIPRLV